MTKHDVKFVSVSNFSIEQEGIVDLTMCNSISEQLACLQKITKSNHGNHSERKLIL